MPRLFDDQYVPRVLDRRQPKPPVEPVVGPHTYRLRFDNREDETIIAESATEAVALREGGPDSRLPYQISDLTEIEAWIARHHATMEEGLTDRRVMAQDVNTSPVNEREKTWPDFPKPTI